MGATPLPASAVRRIQENPRQTLENLMNARYPIYAQADLTVLSRDVKKETMVEEVLAAITAAGPRNQTR